MSIYKFFNFKTMQVSFAVALLLAGTAQAGYITNTSWPCNASRVEIGGSYTRANIKVKGQPSFRGNLGGLEGSYEYKPWNSFYGGLDIAWKQGKTENSFAERKLVYVDVQERLGYTFASCCNDLTLTLFSGFGYRYLGHKLKQFEESIDFDYNEFYVPVGFYSEYFFCFNWSLGLNFTWMPQVYPTVGITPLKGARWNLKNSAANVAVELPLTYFLAANRCYSLVFKPFYERWEDGRSTAKTSSGQRLGLPKNTYNFWGAEFNIAILF